MIANQAGSLRRWMLVVAVAFIRADGRLAAADDVAALMDGFGAPNWRCDVDAPALSLGAPNSFDYTHLLSPCVARIDGKFYLWYVGSRGKVADRIFRLGLATSDDGRKFERFGGGPVLAFPDGRRSILTPTLLSETDCKPIRENGKLRMWFSATDFQDPTQLHALHESTSDDGIHWSPPSESQLKNVYAPTILRDGDVYRLWYTDVSAEPWCFRHATSRDGRQWNVDAEPVLTVRQAWETKRLFYPCVRKVETGFVMWYGAYWRDHSNKTAVGVAVSRDGRAWTRSPNNPVLRPEESRPWESHYTTSESVLRLDDGSWRIWYASRTKPPFVNKYFAIGTARWEPAP